MAWGWGTTALVTAWMARGRTISLPVLLAVAAVIRLVFVGTPPVLSDDVYRYLWEGLVLLSGGNPFSQEPALLVGLDDALLARVNHPDVSSAYPPIGLAWFMLLRLIGGTVAGAQAVAGLADLATVAAIAYATRGRATWPALLYALHPLACLESAAGAHIDVPAVACLAWATALSVRSGGTVSVVLATIGAGIKLFPALILPSVLWRAGLKRGLAGLIVGALIVGLAGLPVIGAGPALLRGLRSYATHWVFNGLLFTPLTLVLSPPDARLLLMPIGALVVLVAAWSLRRRPAAQWLVVGAAFVALSPTVHPWYGLWLLVPALLVRSWSGAIVGVSLLGSYGVLSGYDAVTGAWSEPRWLWAATWVPGLVAVGLELGVARFLRRSRPTDSARV